MRHIRKQIWPVVCISDSRICLIDARVPGKHAIPVSCAQYCLFAGPWYEDASLDILWALVAQHLVGIEAKNPKEVVV